MASFEESLSVINQNIGAVSRQREQVRQRKQQILNEEPEAVEALNQPIPERKFGTSVTVQQQQTVIENKQQAQIFLNETRTEKERLDQLDEELRGIQSDQEERRSLLNTAIFLRNADDAGVAINPALTSGNVRKLLLEQEKIDLNINQKIRDLQSNLSKGEVLKYDKARGKFGVESTAFGASFTIEGYNKQIDILKQASERRTQGLEFLGFASKKNDIMNATMEIQNKVMATNVSKRFMAITILDSNPEIKNITITNKNNTRNPIIDFLNKSNRILGDNYIVNKLIERGKTLDPSYLQTFFSERRKGVEEVFSGLINLKNKGLNSLYKNKASDSLPGLLKSGTSIPIRLVEGVAILPLAIGEKVFQYTRPGLSDKFYELDAVNKSVKITDVGGFKLNQYSFDLTPRNAELADLALTFGIPIAIEAGGFALTKSIKFLREPVKIFDITGKTKYTSKDLLVNINTPEGPIDIGKFVLKADRGPTTVLVKTRVDLLLEKVIPDFPQGTILKLDKGFRSVTISDPILIKDGKIMNNVLTARMSEKIYKSGVTFARLQGGTSPGELNLNVLNKLPSNIRKQLISAAEEKLGVPISEENLPKVLRKSLSVQLGEVTNIDLIKVSRSGKSLRFPSPGKSRSIANLGSLIEEVPRVKNQPQNVEFYKSFTGIEDISLPKTRTRKSLDVIRGITKRIEIEFDIGSEPLGKFFNKRQRTKSDISRSLGLIEQQKAGAAIKLSKINIFKGSPKVKANKLINKELNQLLGNIPKATGGTGLVGSSFAGRGIYERTDFISIATVGNIGRNRSSQRNLTKINQASISSLSLKISQTNLNKFLNKDLVKESPRTSTTELNRQLTKLNSKLIQKEITKQILKTPDITPPRGPSLGRGLSGPKVRLPNLNRASRSKSGSKRRSTFADDLFYVPDLSSRVANLTQRVTSKQLTKLARSGSSGINLRRIPILRGIKF